MPKPQINQIWIYWTLTDLLLIAGVIWDPILLYVTIGLTLVQTLHFYAMTPQLSNFAVQVRIAYLLLLLVALVPGLYSIYYLVILGTTAMILFDYCFLARCMALMPWNKKHPYSIRLIVSTFFSKPVTGSVQP
ncbi:hypothetical protein QCB44_02470 [Thiomicrorhabdus sp. zzn3]|uniref:hypothetical protein n=1 Tax=Thiomicrorhabdus sp. zzn3 TaxID=3039775 RepID=UPI002436F22B|nr:hypothetical protein [Thiomicrorhabdus sp. zzn3]MDG6777562.1 hypothetical protein [Thiomicrorhabdus sp. zzn3]